MAIHETQILIVHGDLIEQPVQAIVNAANGYLEGGGGIDGRIHLAAGPELVQACRDYKRKNHVSTLETGGAVLTNSYKINKINEHIHYIIHAVGPNCNHPDQNQNRKSLLTKTYQNVLEQARQAGIRSVGFPAVSTGIYNFPFKEAQSIAFQAILDYLKGYPGYFLEIRLVYYSDSDFKTAQLVWNERFRSSKSTP